MKRIITTVLITASFFTSHASAIEVDKPFKYKLYTSNVFPWIEGKSFGKVKEQKGDMATALQSLLLGSKKNLSMAIYGVSHQSWLYPTLKKIKSNRVKITAIVDQKDGAAGDWSPRNFTYRHTPKIKDVVGVRSITPDVNDDGSTPRRSSIMHNKFFIVDKKHVWTGSTNISNTGIGAEYNANTSILIESEAVANLFLKEHRQMFKSKRFSVHKSMEKPKSNIVKFKDGTKVGVFFSPQHSALDRAVLPFIKKARKTLDIGMFFLTSQTITFELADAAKRGVKIRVIYDALAASHPSSKIDFLMKAGCDVKIEDWGGKMHMKSAIADGTHVLTGSMNWSRNGDIKNDENTLVIWNNKKLASEMSDYYQRLWDSIKTPIRMTALGVRGARAESLASTNSCADGIDNDHDGFVDADDAGCQ